MPQSHRADAARRQRPSPRFGYTGQAFELAGNADSLLVFGSTSVALYLTIVWQFPDTLTRVPIEGRLQGVALAFGQGRVAVFGEAAMFSEQTYAGGLPMGFNSPWPAKTLALR